MGTLFLGESNIQEIHGIGISRIHPLQGYNVTFHGFDAEEGEKGGTDWVFLLVTEGHFQGNRFGRIPLFP